MDDTVTGDLATRLLAAIAETERDAQDGRGIFPSPVVHDDGDIALHVYPSGTAVFVRYTDPHGGYRDMAALRNWADSERSQTRQAVLRSCAAARKIISLHCVRSGTGGDWDTDPPAICNEDSDLWPCDTLRALAEGYDLTV